MSLPLKGAPPKASVSACMNRPNDILTIDGSQGEGGGQILRTSLALSVVTGKPFRIENIRARRPKPGLARQHLVAVEAAATICQAVVEGAALGSQHLIFTPGRPQPGEYHFDIGTAGSTSLVIQTLLPALILTPGKWQIELVGGTHNPLAPPVDFLQKTFLPILRRMGASVELELKRPGFYPAGGGRVILRVNGSSRLEPLELCSRGRLRRRLAWAAVANLPVHIAQREVDTLHRLLAFGEAETAIYQWQAHGPGNIVVVELEYENITEVFTGFGERGKPAEKVAEEVAREVNRYLRSEAPVGEHLADQLLIPLALAGGGRFRTLPLTSHAHTNLETIRYFLDVHWEVVPVNDQEYEVRVLSSSPG